MAEKRPLTFAGDESGDVSFTFDKGASRYFVVAFIGTTQPDEMREALVSLRRERSLPAGYEFGFHRTTGRWLRPALLATISELDFRAWAIVVDKNILSDTFRVMHRQAFYAYFVSELVRLVPKSDRQGATLLLDQFDEAGHSITRLKQVLKAREITHEFRRIRAKRSRSEDLIQVADIVAGAVLRRFLRREMAEYRLLEDKFDLLEGYRVQENRPASSRLAT